MKKLFITAMFAIAIVSSSIAAPVIVKAKTNNNISQSVNAPSLVVADNYKKAIVVIEGEKIEMFYDLEGSLIGISKTFAYDKLPKSALTNLAAKYAYPAYDLKECIVFENAENEIGYYVSLMKNNERLVLQIDIYGAVSEL
jgi:hypothetical protein